MTIYEAHSVVLNWRQKLVQIPPMHSTEYKLAPISHYVKSIDQNISAQMEIVVSKYVFWFSVDIRKCFNPEGLRTWYTSLFHICLKTTFQHFGATLMEMVLSKTKLDFEEQRRNCERRIEAREKLNDKVFKNATETLRSEIRELGQ